MKSFSTKGVKISAKEGVRKAILTLLKGMLQKDCFDAILIPMRVPAEDSYAWILLRDKQFLDDANPIAPIMPVQGAKALRSYTRKGRGSLKIAAMMRPCEIRATIELSKLNQVHLENVTLLSYDCPGAMTFAEYLQDPVAGEKNFDSLLKAADHEGESLKPVCRICEHFSILPVCDLHFGLLGGDPDHILVIPNSEEGKRVLNDMELEISEDLTRWDRSVEELKRKKEKQRAERFNEIKNMVEGFDRLADTFSECIGCHNCQNVCPVCYCRHCYFESEISKPDSDSILLKAKRRGGLSFPIDRVMFHVGRMSHMILSCVSCGLCSDACPVSIPVAETFSYVADSTQRTFEYNSGEDGGEPLPMKTYHLEEIKGIKELVKEAEG